jgi:FtsZ-binding cell division protein ZapB
MSSVDKLSKSVEKAVSEIERLRGDNERLTEKVARLERRLDEAAATSGGSDVWQAERDRLRERLQALAERLEGVLGED